jgi:hypothetical protein
VRNAHCFGMTGARRPASGILRLLTFLERARRWEYAKPGKPQQASTQNRSLSATGLVAHNGGNSVPSFTRAVYFDLADDFGQRSTNHGNPRRAISGMRISFDAASQPIAAMPRFKVRPYVSGFDTTRKPPRSEEQNPGANRPPFWSGRNGEVRSEPHAELRTNPCAAPVHSRGVNKP